MSKRNARRELGATWAVENDTPLTLEDSAADGYGSQRMDGPIDVPKRLALVAAEGGVLDLGNFRLTKIGLEVSGVVTEEQWDNVGQLIRRVDDSLQWLIADWLVYGERIWGHTYEMVAQATGYKPGTLYEYARVAKAIDFSIRIEKLTFAHHQLVASLPQIQQTYWLEQAEVHSWSISQMRTAMAGDLPSLSSNLAYDRLFSRENKPNISRIEKLYVKAGQGDNRARDNVLSQMAEFRRWIDDVERGLKE